MPVAIVYRWLLAATASCIAGRTDATDALAVVAFHRIRWDRRSTSPATALPALDGVVPLPTSEQQPSRELGSLIRQAVRLRAIPTEEQIGRYFARCVPESARSDVARALTGKADRAQSRRLVHRGLPPVRDWQVGARTLRAVAHGIRDGLKERSAATVVGLQAKALSSACGRHFGAPWRDLVAVGVWEGVAELFLSTHRRALGTTGRVRTMVG